MRGYWFAKMALMVILFVAAISAVVMYLWNWLLPEIFGLPTITYLQAAGILLLSKIIFGFGKKGGPPRSGPSWKQKWGSMSDEQKTQWKEKFKEKWCSPPPEKSAREEKE